MDARMKKQAAIFTIVTLVDENDGEIEINTHAVRRAFNDENDTVQFEMTDGTIQLLSDTDADILDESVRKWKSDYPEDFEMIMSEIQRNEYDITTN
jgi:aminoglycoside N3'-acetyltransferase